MKTFTDYFISVILVSLSAYYLGLAKKFGYVKWVNGVLCGSFVFFLFWNEFHIIIAIIGSVLILGAAFYSNKTFDIDLLINGFLGASSFTLWFLNWSYPFILSTAMSRIIFFLVIYLCFIVALIHVPSIFPFICHALVGAYLFILGVDMIADMGIMDMFSCLFIARVKVDYSGSTYIPLLIYIVLFFFGFYMYCIRHQEKRLTSMIHV